VHFLYEGNLIETEISCDFNAVPIAAAEGNIEEKHKHKQKQGKCFIGNKIKRKADDCSNNKSKQTTDFIQKSIISLK